MARCRPETVCGGSPLGSRLQLAVTLFEGVKLISINNFSGPEPLFLVYYDPFGVGHRDLFEYQSNL